MPNDALQLLGAYRNVVKRHLQQADIALDHHIGADLEVNLALRIVLDQLVCQFVRQQAQIYRLVVHLTAGQS